MPRSRYWIPCSWKATDHTLMSHSPAPVPPPNHPLRHTYNPLFSNAFCVCQIDAVLHYSLRTESTTESKCRRNRQICRQPQTPWHTQNGPEPRVARRKPRSEKANREKLALKSGGGVRTWFKLALATGEYCCGCLSPVCGNCPFHMVIFKLAPIQS